MILLYDLGLRLYYLGIKAASITHEKARLWVAGRTGIFERISTAIGTKKNQHPILWIHCASLGEFEQSRPIIESFKAQYPRWQVFLTFYSPSGYEIRKNYPFADYVFYLPLDTKANARRFLEIVQPDIAIFVKYEFWYHFLSELRTRNTPSFLISAIFNENQIFFKPYGRFFRKILHTFTTIFVQNKESLDTLQKFGFDNIIQAGDTRIDRVMTLSKNLKDFPVIEAFADGQKVLIAGSTWHDDEKIITHYANQIGGQTNGYAKIIIVPHEVSEKRLIEIRQSLRVPNILYSEAMRRMYNGTDAEKSEASQASVLVIDHIGSLSAIYRYGHLAYVGGGFGKGIHSTLEPGAFGLPIIFGPKYQKFEEATQLIQSKGAFTIKSYAEFESIMIHLKNEAEYNGASKSVEAYLSQNQGATKIILSTMDHEITKIRIQPSVNDGI